MRRAILQNLAQYRNRLARSTHGLERYGVDIGIARLGRLKFICLLQGAKGVLIAPCAYHRQSKGMMGRSSERRLNYRLAQKLFRLGLAPKGSIKISQIDAR